jgi:hypothetical protein
VRQPLLAVPKTFVSIQAKTFLARFHTCKLSTVLIVQEANKIATNLFPKSAKGAQAAVYCQKKKGMPVNYSLDAPF